MRYIDINESRLCNILDTLLNSYNMISKQGRLGIVDGRCCNHLNTPSGETIGCLVGCLVGPTNFAVGNTATAMDLDDAKLALAFKNATGGCNWSHLSVEDRCCYQRLLAALQSLHDSSPSFGFAGTELVLFVLRALINRVEDIVHRLNHFPHNDVEYIDFSLTVGNNDGENFNSLYRRITDEINQFIVKK